MNKYFESKEKLREMAQEWQLDFNNHNYSWADIVFYNQLFTRLGKRYGLLREFKENGII